MNKGVIAEHFSAIMRELGLDLTDPSLKGTPDRVAKMYVDELCKGLSEDNYPKVTTFPNDGEYSNMLLVKDIRLTSMCEHHFLPILGKCHVAYIPGKEVLGLSKLNRLVDYVASRPQLQERLTVDIFKIIEKECKSSDVAIFIEADHHCCKIRGIKDPSSMTVTTYYGGAFSDDYGLQERFLKMAGV